MQLLQPEPVCTCHKREGSRQSSQKAKQPALGQPQPSRGKGDETGNRNSQVLGRVRARVKTRVKSDRIGSRKYSGKEGISSFWREVGA